MVKKQTIWLLTMLSLVVVLSVYYVTTPDGPKSDMVSKSVEQLRTDSKKAGEIAVKTSGDEQFAQLRLEMEDKRSEAKEKLQEVITSVGTSAEEKSKAKDQLEAIEKVSAKEAVLETLIKSQGYKDALVRADGTDVQITVKADKYSSKEANNIIQLVTKEIGAQKVAVRFDPAK
ncbi:SpoIIIAH-like family protein [Ectobacillus antri]|jgi:stage III sporulation protein AH|uniref:SpoIIIAH-like family protein n=1 Tax=Ectobacillus antri TaxID=2486280 RepID=A0ABT6H2X2_9BACI|nr:SpoIIIAH-like family protein [Ectobacillus antri]MDG4655597.1 SpoIIIAH-like family protein [Ectobacillus antri]MDG5753355.1 SpoIIIAH-like family protein [Ectobacillus antri]